MNTSVGQTERVNIPKIITQGGTWGPILCSNSIDKIGKYAIEKGKSFKYKSLVDVIPLGMVDDILSISKCGFSSVEMNISINTQIELKKMQFHVPTGEKKGKCQSLHVGKVSEFCHGMKVHGKQAERVTETQYLGDILRADGKNVSNIKSRVGKGIGLISDIMSILKCVSFGSHYFEIAKVLREARLINGILTNAEIWYSLGISEIESLEKIDRMFLRQVFAVPQSVSWESLYLELGVIPLKVVLMSRRISYLHYLSRLDKNEMLYRVFSAQWKYPVKGDWTLEVKQNMCEFEITMNLEELSSKSKLSFKRLLREKTREYALKKLLEAKEKHSKMSNLHYKELKTQNYLKDPNISVEEAKNIFAYRTRMAEFKENFKGKYSNHLCVLCSTSNDTQEHSFSCREVTARVKLDEEYKDIFKKNISRNLSKSLLEMSI